MGLLFDSWLNLFIVVWFASLVYFFDWSRNKLRYFDRRNVAFVQYNIRTFLRAVVAGVNIGESFDQIYKNFVGEKYVGLFIGLEPCYLIRDPTIVNSLAKEDNLNERWKYGIDEFVDPIAANLYNISCDKWKRLRNLLDPHLTKEWANGMFSFMQGCANSMVQQLRKSNPKPDEPINVRQLFHCSTLTILASCGLGVEPDSNKDEVFKDMIESYIKPSPIKVVLRSVLRLIPFLSSFVKLTPKPVEEFFFDIIQNELKRRRNAGMQKPDFFQLLIYLNEKSDVPEKANQETQQQNLRLSDKVICGQAMMFLEEGYSNINGIISVACYHLSKNPLIQKKLRKHLREAKKRFGIINYEAVCSIPLLDHCISESLRLFPPKPIVTRYCKEELTIDGGFTIEKGSHIVFPLSSLQNDANYWIKPDIYDPERFSTGKILPGTYLPFGFGSRACIGQKFSLLHIKVMLAKLIENFDLIASSRMPETLSRGKWLDNDLSSSIYLHLQAIDLSTI